MRAHTGQMQAEDSPVLRQVNEQLHRLELLAGRDGPVAADKSDRLSARAADAIANGTYLGGGTDGFVVRARLVDLGSDFLLPGETVLREDKAAFKVIEVKREGSDLVLAEDQVALREAAIGLAVERARYTQQAYWTRYLNNASIYRLWDGTDPAPSHRADTEAAQLRLLYLRKIVGFLDPAAVQRVPMHKITFQQMQDETAQLMAVYRQRAAKNKELLDYGGVHWTSLKPQDERVGERVRTTLRNIWYENHMERLQRATTMSDDDKMVVRVYNQLQRVAAKLPEQRTETELRFVWHNFARRYVDHHPPPDGLPLAIVMRQQAIQGIILAEHWSNILNEYVASEKREPGSGWGEERELQISLIALMEMLRRLHVRGIYHRDLGSGNIMLEEVSNYDSVWESDGAYGSIRLYYDDGELENMMPIHWRMINKAGDEVYYAPKIIDLARVVWSNAHPASNKESHRVLFDGATAPSVDIRRLALSLAFILQTQQEAQIKAGVPRAQTILSKDLLEFVAAGFTLPMNQLRLLQQEQFRQMMVPDDLYEFHSSHGSLLQYAEACAGVIRWALNPWQQPTEDIGSLLDDLNVMQTPFTLLLHRLAPEESRLYDLRSQRLWRCLQLKREDW